jgi:hypothetical protein
MRLPYVDSICSQCARFCRFLVRWARCWQPVTVRMRLQTLAFLLILGAGPMTPLSQAPLRVSDLVTQSPEAEEPELIQRALDSNPEWPVEVHEFYAARQHQPAWMSANGRAAAHALVERMRLRMRTALRPPVIPSRGSPPCWPPRPQPSRRQSRLTSRSLRGCCASRRISPMESHRGTPPCAG